MYLTDEPTSSTDTLLQSLRSISLTATGRSELLGLPSATSEAPLHQLETFRDEAERLIARRVAQDLLKVGSPETAGPCTRGEREAGQGFTHHFWVDRRNGARAHSAQLADLIDV